MIIILVEFETNCKQLVRRDYEIFDVQADIIFQIDIIVVFRQHLIVVSIKCHNTVIIY